MMSSGRNLLSIADAEKLSIDQVWKLYGDYISRSQVKLISSFGFGREIVDRAEGCYIYTRSGKKLLDLTGGIGVLNHGHNHPNILKVRNNFAAAQRMEVHKNFFSPYTAVLAHNVAQLLPGDLNISYFPNSGAEAVEGALKVAYKYHNGTRSTVVHSDISFHGKLLGAASVTASPELYFAFPRIEGTKEFKYNNFASILEVITQVRKSDGSSDVYAVVLEPLNASSMRECSAEFLLSVRELCDREGIVLIFDEVYTGWGKTGHLFNFMRCGNLIPDIVTYAKSFGGGKASISGYTCRESVARQAYDNLRDATLHSTTYFGFGEETATAIEAVMTIINDDLVEKSRSIGERFERGIAKSQSIGKDQKFELRGSGALWGLCLKPTWLNVLIEQVSNILPGEFFRDKQIANKLILGALINTLFEDYGIVTYYGSNIENPLIISFPLVAGDKEVDYAVDSLIAIFDESTSSQVAEFLLKRIFTK